jgi:glucose/arabinose dehydrogenase
MGSRSSIVGDPSAFARVLGRQKRLPDAKHLGFRFNPTHLLRVRAPLFVAVFAVVPAWIFASCGNTGTGPGGDASTVSRMAPEVIPIPYDGPNAPTYCDLPGSLIFGTNNTTTLIAGGKSAAPSLNWLTLPQGFCAHYFGHVATARQMRFAPGGELFVASPSQPTAGGAPSGLGAIVVLADDDQDGYADGDSLPHPDGSPQSLTLFQSGLTAVQGLMFAPGFFYYQDSTSGDDDIDVGTEILRIPYTKGQRVASGTAVEFANITIFSSPDHWPKTLDMADDGTIYVGNGGDQSQQCNSDVFPRPFTGGVLKIGGKGDPVGGTPVARGFRNPIAVRCQHGHNLCFSTELALDGSEGSGGREKLVPIRQGDDWGYPCCATTGLPYACLSGTPNCSSVATETVSFVVGDTPFGIDFETGVWPAPYTNNILVTLHGAVFSWVGARVVAIPTQANGMPVPSSDLGTSTFVNLVTGWDDGLNDHGRPAAVTFSADGRAFIANDNLGDIFWIAPIGLKTKS